jgi:ATP-grasp domain-containing protein/L-aminoacid ligase-like protein
LATTTGYQTRAFGEAAETSGVRLVFATDRCHQLEDPWQDHAIPIRFHEEEASADAIIEAAKQDAIDGIITVGDRPTVIAARVAARLGLPWHSAEAAAIAGDKERTRERLRDAGLPVPWFLPSRLDADSLDLARSVTYPCVVKPVALSGSRGVMRADHADDFRAAFDRLRALVRRPELLAERNDAHGRVLIEGFIPGREFALEGLLHQGALKVLALFDKPDPLDGPFFEETIYVTPSSLDAAARQRVVDTVARAAAAIGLRHGPIHAECRVNDRGVFVLEVAARPIGGLCARALQFTRKGVDARLLFSLEELLIRHALGESPEGWTRETCASGVMMIPIPAPGVYRGVSGVDDAKAVTGIDGIAITAKTDQILVPLPEGASYLGFIFARGDTTAAVDRALREAHTRLQFAIEPELRVVQSRHGAV